MENNTTCIFDVNDLKTEMIKSTLKDIYSSLTERGYNPVNQIVGYLISGDPGFISSYKDARQKIMLLDRSEIVAVLLEGFIAK